MDRSKKLILLVAIIGVLISSVMIIRIIMEYRNASSEYEALQEFIKEVPINEDEIDKAAGPEPKDNLRRNYNRNDFPSYEVDYSELKKINEDYSGWLYIDSVDISYPFVQGVDNEYYLHKTFEKEDNFAGCVFMDYELNRDFSSYNTFIYGHAMKNGTMFGHLKQYRLDSEKWENDPYIYLYLEKGIYRYKIYSYYLDKPDSKMYYACDNKEGYEKYIEDALGKSMIDCGMDIDSNDNSITLVTCAGTGADKKRFFVHAIFVDRYLY